jgi:small subunit ribosomal protein S6
MEIILHKNVNFDAKIENNYELCIINYEFFCTFAPAFCKNNIYLLIKSSMNQYETVFILTPVLSDEQTKETVAKFKKVLTDKGAEIVNEEAWGLKKMAYAIDKKSTGFYFLVEFKAEPSVIKTLETAFRRDEKVIRFQTVKLEKYAIEYAEKRRNKFGKKEEA